MKKHIKLSSKVKNAKLAITACIIIAPIALFVNSIAHKHIAERNQNFAANQPSIKIISQISGKISSDVKSAPGVLSASDEKLYKQAFAAGKSKDWAKFDLALKSIDNETLKGAALASKYLSGSYEASEAELSKWLEKYQDMPEAQDIVKKIKKINPKIAEEFNLKEKPALAGYSGSNGLSGKIESAISNKNWSNRKRPEIVWKKVNKLIEEGQLNKAKQIITSAKIQPMFEHVEIDVMRWNLANGYFMAGNDNEAVKFAELAAKRSGAKIPGVYWALGLASYRLGDYDNAAESFESLANAKGTSKWEKSAGAFWAYRSFDKDGDDDKAQEMLKIAAANPYTFYGILAARAMKHDIDYSFSQATIKSGELKKLMKIPAIERAVAYSEIGMEKKAEIEMRKIYLRVNEVEKKQLLQLATLMKLPGLQARMATNLKASEGNTKHDYANYPVPHWKPKAGFKVEPALLFALMRLESGFNPNAKSNAGAVGLMQLMPETAQYISAKKLDEDVTKEDLLSPETNLTVAQEYVNYLLGNKNVQGNMFFFAAAYNAGPGKMNSWLDEVKYNKDPLLFIESIPVRETRNFIEQVMANYWIYDKRLNGESDSIDMVLKGEWPIYTGSIAQAPTYLAQVKVVTQ